VRLVLDVDAQMQRVEVSAMGEGARSISRSLSRSPVVRIVLLQSARVVRREPPTRRRHMEDVIVPLGFFGLLAFIVHATMSGIVRTRMMSRQAQVLTRLIESAGPGAGVAGLVESGAGRSLLEGRIDRRTVMLDRVISGVTTFIVLSATGVTLLLMQTRFSGEDDRAAVWTIGVVVIVVGLAFLLGAAVAFALARRWGLLKASSATDPSRPPPLTAT
jgi:hypothetical protein